MMQPMSKSPKVVFVGFVVAIVADVITRVSSLLLFVTSLLRKSFLSS